MKFLISLLALSSLLCQDALGFSIQQGVFRPRSSLSMTAEESHNKKVIKVGVIGCGRIGIVHLEAISKAPGVVPIMVSNPTISKAEAGEY
jgi:hypothetical protein